MYHYLTKSSQLFLKVHIIYYSVFTNIETNSEKLPKTENKYLS